LARRIVIVGGGIAGLTLAERLTRKDENLDVTVLERYRTPGGLARTFTRDGFSFDIGPHRFHTSDNAVKNYLLEIMGDEHVTIKRRSNVYMGGRRRNWPLTLDAVLDLPSSVLVRCLFDLFRKNEVEKIETFADHVISRYGRGLYDYFFRAYTKKFTGLDPEELHADWAEAGVNRAVIDKNVKADNLLSLVKGILAPKPVSTIFYYPSSGGIQTFCEKQARLVLERGGTIVYGCEATGLETHLGRVTGVKTAGMGTFDSDMVYWSAPLTILWPRTGFRFMDTLLCNIALPSVRDNDYQWCYFGQEDIIFSRLTVPRHFRADMVPTDHDSITAEITIRDDDLRKNPGKLESRLLADLEKVGAVDPSKILFMDWMVVPETYPIYDLDYRRRLAGLKPPQGFRLIGRCGSFWYNNMDHSIGQALAISAGRDFSRDFWKKS